MLVWIGSWFKSPVGTENSYIEGTPSVGTYPVRNIYPEVDINEYSSNIKWILVLALAGYLLYKVDKKW